MSTNSLSIESSSASRVHASPSILFEGWWVLLLGALSAGLLGFIVGDYAVNADPATMAMLATAGYLLGYVLARTLLPDLAAHLLTFLAGVLVALAAIDPGLLWSQLRAGEWQLAFDRYDASIRGFLSSVETGDRFDSDVAVFAIGLTMWLVGYTAAWMLFRRGWIFWALALPGAILLVTFWLEPDRPTWPALIYLGLSIAIVAGYTAIVRKSFWRSRAMGQPSAFGQRSILLGVLIAAMAIGAGLVYSFDLDDRLQERVFDSGDRLGNWAVDRFEDSGSKADDPNLLNGNYSDFADQFKIGDGVPTGDTPIVVVQANGEEYLAARRLNEYDGSGWKSTTSNTSHENPTSVMAFAADQPMNLPRDQVQHRTQDQATISLIAPTGQLLFTIDQHYSADVPTRVRVGWEEIDSTYIVGEIDLTDVPVDVRQLLVLLQAAQFDPVSTGGIPQFESSGDQLEYERWLSILQNYPVTSELSWTEDGRVQAHLTGRVPVYSDVEAVFSSDYLPDATYSVIGLVPNISPAELSAAGIDYPSYVSDTYLTLPDSVTQETRDLASQIVADAGATEPYAQAAAIQDYLRANFTYQLDAGGAPDGRDVVDYFLFDSKVGRCDHYSSAMAVMLRSLGVPTRIVTGLAPVPFDSEMGGYVYRGRNAHAWVEIYFPGYGWIQFEPTPTQSAVDVQPRSDAPVSTPDRQPTVQSATNTDNTPAPQAPTPTPTPAPVPAVVDTESSRSDDGGVNPIVPVAALGAALVAAGAVFLFWRRRSMYAGQAVARANFGRLQRLGRFIGVDASPELTPREYAARFGSARPRSASGAMQVADAFTQEQYATNVNTGSISRESELGWKEAKAGAADWRIWRRR